MQHSLKAPHNPCLLQPNRNSEQGATPHREVLYPPPLCRQHPWFTVRLPRYLAVMQADTVATASVLDQDLVDDVAALGFDREYVLSSLGSSLHNKVQP